MAAKEEFIEIYQTNIHREGGEELLDYLSNKSDFFTAPASARFYGCQLVISTHSPFLLALEGARIYDLDQTPAQLRRWTQLDNVRTYHDFFRAHEQEFKA